MKFTELESVDIFFIFIAIVIISCGIMAFYYVGKESKDWDIFKKQHKCNIVGYMDGENVVGVGVGSRGPVTTISRTPDKEGWLCDDGMTYWKNI